MSDVVDIDAIRAHIEAVLPYRIDMSSLDDSKVYAFTMLCYDTLGQRRFVVAYNGVHVIDHGGVWAFYRDDFWFADLNVATTLKIEHG